MKKYVKFIIFTAAMMMVILIVTLPAKRYRSEETQKGVEAAGVNLLKNMEEKDLYVIEEEIESVQEQLKKDYSVHENTGKTVSEEGQEAQREPAGELGEAQTNPVDEISEEQAKQDTELPEATTESAAESADGQIESYEVKDPSNYRIPLRIPEGTVDYCAGVDVNAYHYRELYASSLIMGDSIAEALIFYNILNPSSVVAKIGASMHAVDEQLNAAVGLGPQNVFLYFGLNDVEAVKSDYEKFRTQYENMIVKVKQTLPNAHIYANLLFPVMNPGIAGGPEYEDLTPYNEIIKEVCEKYQVPCLDSRGIVKEEYYEPDGCHFKYQFYAYWLYSMALQAGLLP